MVCIQCYLPPILFMIYMKVLHPFLAPFLEPAIDKVVSLIWGPQAVQQGCPIKPKSKQGESSTPASESIKNDSQGDQPTCTASSSDAGKSKDD